MPDVATCLIMLTARPVECHKYRGGQNQRNRNSQANKPTKKKSKNQKKLPASIIAYKLESAAR